MQCMLILDFGNGHVAQGSGTLIGAKYVLTAGHCVYDREHGWGAVKAITAIPARDGATEPFGRAYGTKVRVKDGWKYDGKYEYDYALVTLNKTVGNQTGWMGLVWFSDGTIDDYWNYLVGYPGDKPYGTQWGHEGGGHILDCEDLAIFYHMDTYNGQSGSAAYCFFNSVRCVTGVHRGGSYDIGYNYGPWLTSARITQLRDWMATGY